MKLTALRIAPLFTSCVLLLHGPHLAVSAAPPQYTNRLLMFGPLACATESAYIQWVAGPLRGVAPPASAFSATVSAKVDPYTVVFSPTSGSNPPKMKYTIASSTCIDPSWASVPAGEKYPVGPFTLTGSYTQALIAAQNAHAKTAPKTFTPADDFAYLNSPGSGVVIVTVPSKGNSYLVGFYQVYASGKLIIGCYKEQHYFVDPSTFAVSPTTAGCPG